MNYPLMNNYGAIPQQFQPMYYPNQQVLQQPQPQQTQTIKMSSDVVVVKSEQNVVDFPVAPGTSTIFKIENQPLLFIKTMGISQFDSPTIEKWIKDEKDAKEEIPVTNSQEISELRSDIDIIKEELSDLRDKVLYNKAVKRTAKEVDKND